MWRGGANEENEADKGMIKEFLEVVGRTKFVAFDAEGMEDDLLSECKNFLLTYSSDLTPLPHMERGVL
jgi:hypothetical protein